MDELTVYPTDRGHYAVRPLAWAGAWDKYGRIKENGLNHTAIFAYKEDAEWFVNKRNAEEQGRLLELPCKVSGAVFVDLHTLPFIDMEYSEKEQTEIPKFLPARVISYRKNARATFIKLAVRANWLEKWIDAETGPESAYYEKERYFTFPISSIGKTVFLTREEAEAKLKEMEGKV